ncbi:MAG TPA: hypothetical protein VF215_07885 [Thermoanaerobaculia bacterium]
MPRDREKLYATGRGGVTPPEWDQAMDLVSTGAVRDFLEDLLGYLDVGLPVSPLANDWMREQADRAAQLAERGIEEIARAAGALERIAGLLERAEQAAHERSIGKESPHE